MKPESDERGPVEQEAVRTTIVGGRPPGSGKSLGMIPRGIEVLVKKASVDPAFRAVLVEKRAAAADEITLPLEPSEAAILNGIPAAQLEAIIDRTHVGPRQRAAFLGKAAVLMLAALGAATLGCEREPESKGMRPDRPPKQDSAIEKQKEPDTKEVSRGVRPDMPKPPGTDLRTKGIRPDVPEPKSDPNGAKLSHHVLRSPRLPR